MLPAHTDPKLWLVLLREIKAAGGSAQPEALYPKVRTYFPTITDADLAEKLPSGDNKYRNRVRWARQFLVDLGCIDKSQRGVWRITPAGTAWLDATWKDAGTDYSGVAKPPGPAGPATKGLVKDPPAVAWNPSAKKSGQAPAPVTVVADAAEQLCQRLQSSQRKSSAPQQFEKDLAEAFAWLGFNARHIGGTKETDVLLAAPLGSASYSVVVDAKTSHTGKIPDSQINWSVIDKYRKDHGATYAAVVGERFSGGQLHGFADQHEVALITTDMLIDVLRLHAESPFNLLDLRDLFRFAGLAKAALDALRERHRESQLHWLLVRQVLTAFEGFHQPPAGGIALKADHLHPLLLNAHLLAGLPYSSAPTQLDVADAVALLGSRALRILAEVPGSDGAYQLAMPIAVANRRLRALARFVEAPQAGQHLSAVAPVAKTKVQLSHQTPSSSA